MLFFSCNPVRTSGEISLLYLYFISIFYEWPVRPYVSQNYVLKVKNAKREVKSVYCNVLDLILVVYLSIYSFKNLFI